MAVRGVVHQCAVPVPRVVRAVQRTLSLRAPVHGCGILACVRFLRVVFPPPPGGRGQLGRALWTAGARCRRPTGLRLGRTSPAVGFRSDLAVARACRCISERTRPVSWLGSRSFGTHPRTKGIIASPAPSTTDRSQRAEILPISGTRFARFGEKPPSSSAVGAGLEERAHGRGRHCVLGVPQGMRNMGRTVACATLGVRLRKPWAGRVVCAALRACARPRVRWAACP